MSKCVTASCQFGPLMLYTLVSFPGQVAICGEERLDVYQTIINIFCNVLVGQLLISTKTYGYFYSNFSFTISFPSSFHFTFLFFNLNHLIISLSHILRTAYLNSSYVNKVKSQISKIICI